MKQVLIFMFTLFFYISFSGCEGDNPTIIYIPDSTVDSVSQVTFTYADLNYYFQGECIEAWGVITSNPFPEFIHLKLNETLFRGKNYYEIYPGYLSFGLQNARIFTDLTPLYVEVKTSFGQVNGRIALPDQINILTLVDALPLGEPLIISWDGSNADFYYAQCEYEWSENNSYGNVSLGTFVEGNSVTFSDSIFIYNGVIYNIIVQPINGPLPEAGAIGNMSGVGSGFLYCMTSPSYYYEYIIVGAGALSMRRSSSFDKNERVVHERISERIENIILDN